MNSNANTKMPTPPKVGRKDGLAPSFKKAPEDVRYGVWAWLSVSALQVLSAVVQYVANVADPRALRQQAKDYLDNKSSFGPALDKNMSVDSLTTALNLSMTVLLIAAAAICAYLATRAGRGAVYSRSFLNVGSLYLAFSALLLVFSTPPATMPVGFVLLLGVLAILSGVIAPVGMWFMARPGNREWFGIPSDAEIEKYQAALERRREEQKKEKSDKTDKANKADKTDKKGGR